MSDTLVIIPTYNNAGTLEDVLRRTLAQGLPVLVVDDGSTDGTRCILDAAPISCPEGNKLYVIHHEVNRGKGVALKTGFQWALEHGFSYALTLDSDGQHYPEDIPAVMAAKAPHTLVVGSRNVRGVNAGSSFANKFSNFWFKLYTWQDLPDTQTGYRLYPLQEIPSLRLLSARYEAELTLLVFSAWKGLKLLPLPVRVDYPEDRVTHFRPGPDFARISLLNTLLLLVALFYGYPRMFLRLLFHRNY